MLAAVASAKAYNVVFEGVSHVPVKVAADKKTGLNDIYVVYDMSEVTSLTVQDISGTKIAISEYGNLGGGYASPLNFDKSGSEILIKSPVGNRGYLLEDDDQRYNFWIVDYKDYKFSISSIALSSAQDCDYTVLEVTADCKPIHFFTINGQQQVLSRDIRLTYHNLVWNDEAKQFDAELKEETLEYIQNEVTLTPALYCSTDVNVSGDRFMDAWGMGVNYTSATFPANGVAVETEARQAVNDTQDENYVSNQIRSESDGLGGSAPAQIDFMAYVTDAVIHYEWQMSSQPDFSEVTYRFNEQDLSYTFLDEGQYYLRFIGSNSDGSCEAISDTYTVSIGASDLRIPNAFSPDDDGVNDIWKVGYRSLLKFKCWIFDKNGTQLHYFDDPEQGWDGKYHGRKVSPGVYYYVIEAEGADGKKYKKGGDINILKYNSMGNNTGSAQGGE